MLYLEINGHKAPRRRCKDAVELFVKNHMPRHKLDITVHHKGLIREGVYGWCTVEDCNWKPRSFLLEIHNRLDSKDYLTTLFHELVHVHQHVRGDLHLQDMKDGKPNPSRTVYHEQFINTLTNLCWWWD